MEYGSCVLITAKLVSDNFLATVPIHLVSYDVRGFGLHYSVIDVFFRAFFVIDAKLPRFVYYL